MKPKTLSATALHVAELCPARFKAEYIDKSRNFGGGTAASLGTAVHGALENYVKVTYIDQAAEPSLKSLLSYFKLSYIQTFNTYDTDTAEFADGQELLFKWFENNDFKDVLQVISCEIKSNFLVPTSIGDLPFNYIWDRFDQTGEREYRVVDYKSSKWNVKPEDLKKKLQARAYGLAAAIQLKNEGKEYDRIWVEFDMLRYDRVGIVFSRAEIAATWRYIKETVEEVIATSDDNPPERLNSECLFCVRKAGCDALKKNIAVGGLHSVSTIEQAIDLRAELEWQRKGINSLLAELDNKILVEAKKRDLEEYESDLNRLRIGVGRTRAVDAERVQHVLGKNLFEKYGSMGITLGNIDKLLKGKELTPEQKAQLRGLIYYTYGNPSVKIEPRNPIDDD